MVISFKKSHACTATLSVPYSVAGHHQPTCLLETSGHSKASLGQFLSEALLLSPESWCTRFCLCPPRVYAPVLCTSGSPVVRLMVTSSKRAYAMSKSVTPRAPVPVEVHC